MGRRWIDMNNYDSEHVVTAHRHMSRADWLATTSAWRLYYSPSIETLSARDGKRQQQPARRRGRLLSPAPSTRCAPAQGGLLRLRSRISATPELRRNHVQCSRAI
jgi:hypothetical protein